jgi:hypothetical protein
MRPLSQEEKQRLRDLSNLGIAAFVVFFAVYPFFMDLLNPETADRATFAMLYSIVFVGVFFVLILYYAKE